MEGRSYLLAYALDTAHGLNIQLLGRELDGGVARVNTGKLDMLADGIGQYLSLLGDSVHLYLLSMLDKLAHHHGMDQRQAVGRTRQANDEEQLRQVYARTGQEIKCLYINMYTYYIL